MVSSSYKNMSLGQQKVRYECKKMTWRYESISREYDKFYKFLRYKKSPNLGM